MIILIIAIRESVIYYKIEWDLLTESLNFHRLKIMSCYPSEV